MAWRGMQATACTWGLQQREIPEVQVRSDLNVPYSSHNCLLKLLCREYRSHLWGCIAGDGWLRRQGWGRRVTRELQLVPFCKGHNLRITHGTGRVSNSHNIYNISLPLTPGNSLCVSLSASGRLPHAQCGSVGACIFSVLVAPPLV